MSGLLDDDLDLGEEIEFVTVLGQGASATVYEIRRGGVTYALKVHHDRDCNDQTPMTAFVREAALLARTNHPGVPRVFDVGLAGGRPYLVMEQIAGRPLTEYLLTGSLDEGRVIRLGLDVAGALGAAHRAGLVHRDVKPSNIVVTENGNAHLIDFGLAVTGQRNGEEEQAGTFDYCAPEQAGMLARPVDGRSDLYALGVVLFECATGELPFRCADSGELVRMHATAPPPDIRTIRPRLSARLAEVIGRLLAKDPDDRYQDAWSLAVDLSKLTSEKIGSHQSTDDLFLGRERDRGELLGRERELDELLELWQRAKNGDGGLVLLLGPAGVGKTHLATELGAAVAAAGISVLSGGCGRDGQGPAAALRSAVEGYLRMVTGLPGYTRSITKDRLRAAAGDGARLVAALSPTLAEWLGVRALTADAADRHEQFAAAVAAFLAGLARESNGLLLLLDDAQWLDPTGLAILGRLSEEAEEAPLLIVATARDDVPAAAGVAAVRAAAGDRFSHSVPIGPLDDDAVARLVKEYLSGCEVTGDLISEVTARGAGNPFTIIEYLRALIDAGALRPSWGTWQLDTELLLAVRLPSDVMKLLVARADGLAGRAREVLTVAAAIGPRVDPRLLAAVTGTDAAMELAEAASRNLLRAEKGGFAFAHERVREALLAAVTADQRAELHQRIAVVLDKFQDQGGDHTYAVAHHYASGQRTRTPERVFATNWEAGRLALAEYAPASAVDYLATAEAVANATGIRLGGEFRHTLGAAFLATGRLAEAEAHLTAGLADEPDPMCRARLFHRLAITQRVAGRGSLSIETVRYGLAELGRPMPQSGFPLALRAIPPLVEWLVLGGRPRVGRLKQPDLEWLRQYTKLCSAGITSSILALHPASQLAFTMRIARVVHRLPPGNERAECLGQLAMFACGLRLRRRAARSMRHGLALAADLGDPVINAHLAWAIRLIDLLEGRGDGSELYRVAVEQRRWLDLDFYLNAVGGHTLARAVRGHAEEALAIHARWQADLPDHSEETGSRDLMTAVARNLLGRDRERISRVDLTGRDPGPQIFAVIAMLHAAVERDELGAQFEEAAGLLAGLRRVLRGMPPDFMVGFAYLALGRLALARRALSEPLGSPKELRRRLVAAESAVRQLGRLARGPLPQAYHGVVRADLALLRGESHAALRLLGRLEPVLGQADAPLVEFEAARVAARALRALGCDAAAGRKARQALDLAEHHGWIHRCRAIRAEFGLVRGLTPRAGSPSRPISPAPGDRDRRRLRALQQVSLAAATVLDPQRLARVALDETLRIFGAERAILFLTDSDGQVNPTFGRDTSQHDLDTLADYSASLVDRVAGTREAIVVTGSEEGAALGSRSVVVHGLRSVMIAPLELDGRLLGVVYLDSRVAKGVFAESDVGILTAVTNHIAVSLETARVAQLEVAVRVARQQRDVAETLRQAMADLTATLDPEQVLRLLLDIVGRIVPAEKVRLFGELAGSRTVIDPSGKRSTAIGSGALGSLKGCLRDDPATTPEVRALLGPVRSWLAVPVGSRTAGTTGVLLAGASTETFGDEHVQLVAAVAGQASTAYDNATLYRQVQRLASIDPLTGLSNRRHFTEHATRQLGVAQRNHRPLIACMIDIDHFKRVNDSHGHAAGDEVIRVIAGVLRENIRDHDVVGRYGGEEFSLIATEINGDPIELAERVRAAIAATTIQHSPDPIRVTVSIGIAELKPGDTLDRLLDRADQALYQAKRAGRNRVWR